MKRLALLSFALVFTACGGGGSDSGGAKCGDGVVSGSEMCDDGNTSSGDGCDSTCRIERSGACGDGTVDVQFEQCDDGNTVGGDGCSAGCSNEGVPSTCGNGTIEGTEQCDDHNTVSNDGCSSICQTEVSGDGSCAAPANADLEDDGFELYGELTGTTATGADGFAAAACDGTAGIGGGKDKTYKIMLTQTSNLDVYTYDADFTGALRLTTTPCDAATEVQQSYHAVTGCATDDYPSLYFVAIPAGTYYLTVDGATATDSGNFDISVEAYETYCGDGFLDTGEQCDDDNTTATDGCTERCMITPGYVCDDNEPSVCMVDNCGDGVIDAGEQCDDGANAANDGCSPTCHEEPGYDCTGAPSTCAAEAPGCGDGIVQAGEQCDDDAKVPGDGCSATCTLEFDVTEVEPNETVAQAQMLSAGNHRIKGSFATTTDVDLYKFTTTAPMKLELESYTTIDPATSYDGKGNNIYDCTGTVAIDTYFRLYDSTGNPLDTADYLIADDDDGSNNTGRAYGCSYLGAGAGDANLLPAGTYTLRVSVGIGGAAGAYFMDLKLTP